jgi:hypothetical protein
MSAKTHLNFLIRQSLRKIARRLSTKEATEPCQFPWFRPALPANLPTLSKLASPSLAKPSCSRLAHVDSLPHRPMSDKLPIEQAADRHRQDALLSDSVLAFGHGRNMSRVRQCRRVAEENRASSCCSGEDQPEQACVVSPDTAAGQLRSMPHAVELLWRKAGPRNVIEILRKQPAASAGLLRLRSR